MPLTPQQRSMAVLGGVFGGGLLITFLLVSLISGDDDRRVSIGPNRPTSTSSTSTTTLPPTTITTATLPPTLPPNTIPTAPPNTIPPGTVQTVPTSPPATNPPATNPPATTPTTKAPTTTTTKPKTKAEELDEELEAALYGGPPPDGSPSRVRVVIDEQDNEVRVTWEIDDSLSDEEKWYQARAEATRMLEVIKGFDDGLDDESIILRGTVLNEMTPDPDDRRRAVRVLYERATLDGIDFSSFDPFTVFDEPPADESDLDPPLDTSPPPTTTTSSTTP